MSILDEAKTVADLLQKREQRLVLAESCTGGLVAATLAQIPGISAWLCGSAVTYREQTKQQWIDVSPVSLRRYSAVSRPVAKQMAIGVLERTPEAAISAAITGHLGPGAPVEQDGLVFVSVACRGRKRARSVGVWEYRLDKKTRRARQIQAATLVFTRIAEHLS